MKIKNDVTITINGEKLEIQFPDNFWRDYFAAKAMQAIISTMRFNLYDTQPNENDALIAQRADRIADTMFKERSKAK